MALTASLVVVGPWPVDDSTFIGSRYRRRTLDRLGASPRIEPAGPIRVGLAEIDLTPAFPRPLAGFIGQVRTPFVGVDTPCLARALTVESASSRVTILTADLLLINARLAKAVVERAGVRPDQVYFTSSHTHGGPGGWGEHPLEMLVAGAYDPAYFETLANQLADVVKRSRSTTEAAELAFVEVQARGRQMNRVDPRMPTHDALSALVFRPIGGPVDGPPLAILTVFGAHATVSHPVPPRLGGDYPAALVAELKRTTGARSVLFASGAVGDASPARPKARSQRKSAEALGKALAGDLMVALPSAKFARDVELASLRLNVDLPPVRLPFFGPKLRFSPLLTWWIADRRTHLHALRLGPAVLVGFPGDDSGHLATSLVESTRPTGLSTVATSFNGDFRGYLVSEPVFRNKACYETRWMSFYGPWLGEYFNDLARRMVERLAGGSTAEARPRSDRAEDASRAMLAGLLGLAAIFGRRRRRELLLGTWRFGLFPVAIAAAAVLAFEVDPGLVDWAKVELPSWLTLAGLPMGILGLYRLARSGSGRAALPFWAACALLSGSWLVALMGLRAWARSRFAGRAGSDRPAMAGRPAAVLDTERTSRNR
jgi:MYXO-CTERM domain-containing protein